MVVHLRKIVPITIALMMIATMLVQAPGAHAGEPRSISGPGKEVRAPGANPEWPKFRHDLLNSGSTTSPVPPYPHLVWTRSLGGLVTSSPTIVNDTIYVGSWSTSGVPGRLYALDLVGSGPRWIYVSGPNGIHSSPAVDGGKVYVGTRDRTIVALDAQTGAVVWNVSTGAAVYASPAVSGGSVYVPSLDTYLYALDAATGVERWKLPLTVSSDSSPAVANGMVYLGDSSGIVRAVYESNGSTAWSYNTQGGEVNAAPAIYGNTLYVGVRDVSQMFYALNANTGAELWKRNLTGFIKSSAAVQNGVVYIPTADGTVWALNASDGSVIWNRSGFGSNIQSSPAIAGDRLIFGSDDGFIHVLNATSGDEVWSYQTSAVMDSSPAVYKGYIVIGGNDHVLYTLGFDNDPPRISLTDPKDKDVGIPVGKNITVTFSERIDPNTTAGAFSISPAVNLSVSWDGSGTTATLDPALPLQPNTNYTVTVRGSIADMHGNPLGSDFTFTFTTQDLKRPYVVTTSPASGSVNVSRDAKVIVTFSETMHPASTESATSFMPSVQATFSWDASYRTMTVSPSPSFQGETTYSVSLADSAQDSNGNPLIPYTFNFTTIDDVPPRVVSIDPANGSVNVPLDRCVTVTFHEPVDEPSARNGFNIDPAASGTITVSGSALTFCPDGYAGETTYTITISGVSDLKGNVMASGFTSRFRTVDTTAPYVVSTTPSDGADMVSINTTVTVRFSEEMERSSVESSISSDIVILQMVWDNTSTTLTVIPQILNEATTYHFNISVGAKDISGNALAGGLTLTFTTSGEKPADHPPPETPWWWDLVLKYWWILLLIFIIIMVLAIAIPGRKTLMMYYGVDEEDLKPKKKDKEMTRCEVCYRSLEDEPWVKCKECGKASHRSCIKKIKKCVYCKAPLS